MFHRCRSRDNNAPLLLLGPWLGPRSAECAPGHCYAPKAAGSPDRGIPRPSDKMGCEKRQRPGLAKVREGLAAAAGLVREALPARVRATLWA